MKKKCKIEISLFHENEEQKKFYHATAIFLEEEYMAVPSGDYIDLTNKKIWTVTGMLTLPPPINNKKRMIKLICKDGIQEPYKGMILEKID